MKHYAVRTGVMGLAGIGLALILAACQTATPAPTATPVPSPTPLPELTGDPVRGGVLYDQWWKATRAEAPSADQPLWQTQTSNTRTGADTWRCKECHGWDYKGVDGAYGSGSHKTGFEGIFAAAGRHPFEILAILKGGANPDHDFSTVMDEQALTDLALFVSQAQMDAAELVNADKMPTGGDADKGKIMYEDTCAACHGPEGTAINFGDEAEPEYVGTIAGDNPWEFIHKLRFGQPGAKMPSAIDAGWAQADLANLLTYAQTLPTAPSVSRGGVLYDQWWKVTGAEAPSADQPLWQTQTSNTRTGADTWRCKECHGWDYQGADGAYGSGSHKTGFTGILAAASLSAEDLTAWLTGEMNPDHSFGAALPDSEVSAVVAFIREGLVDTAAYINADKTVNGDPAKGQTTYEGQCAACHGDDGRTLNFGSADEPEYVGTIAADNPWEFFHKVRFGQPGSPMPAAFELDWPLEDVADVTAYAQTLPGK